MRGSSSSSLSTFLDLRGVLVMSKLSPCVSEHQTNLYSSTARIPLILVAKHHSAAHTMRNMIALGLYMRLHANPLPHTWRRSLRHSHCHQCHYHDHWHYYYRCPRHHCTHPFTTTPIGQHWIQLQLRLELCLQTDARTSTTGLNPKCMFVCVGGGGGGCSTLRGMTKKHTASTSSPSSARGAAVTLGF